MSPTAFKQQVTQLISDLVKCYELCDAILQHRRLGSTHESFDRLQDGLKSSASQIQSQYNLMRKVIGSRMDQADEKARQAINTSIRDLQLEVRTKLFDIAYKRRDGRDSPPLPGFRDLLKRWRRIEQGVMDTLQALGQRLEEKKSNSSPKRSYAVKEVDKYVIHEDVADEVTIRLQDLDILLDHMKNSWIEKNVAGNVLYINKFDASKTQWEKPTGYIKQSKGSSRRSSTTSSRRSSDASWEVPQRRRSSKDDIWHDHRGW
jgi:hypothetical protein